MITSPIALLAAIQHRDDWRTVVNGITIALLIAIFGSLLTFAIADRNRIAEIQARNVERIVSLEEQQRSQNAEISRMRTQLSATERQLINMHQIMLNVQRGK